MTHFIAVTGSGPSLRDLLAECKGELAEKGYETFERFTGEEWQDLFGALSTGDSSRKSAPSWWKRPNSWGPSRAPSKTSSGPVPPRSACWSRRTFLRGSARSPSDLLTVRKPARVPFWPKERVSWLERRRKSGVAMPREAAQLLMSGPRTGWRSSRNLKNWPSPPAAG